MSGKRKAKFSIDPAHEGLDIFEQQIVQDVWNDKYQWKDEAHQLESITRIVDGLYVNDTKAHRDDAYEAMSKSLWIPAGRICAGVGTGNLVTLINCFVNRTMEDSMTGIAGTLEDSMYSMQQGSGDVVL